MHFEILVEDQSGKKMLEILVPKMIGEGHSYNVISYKGVGHIPTNMRDTKTASNRILLENLPKLLKGYGKTFAGYGADFPCAVILVCDLDDKCLTTFTGQLQAILDACHPQPETRFCIAIEEGEAWFLGDIPAVKTANPTPKSVGLKINQNDSICGTWEKLADAVYPGGSRALSAKGWKAAGAEKSVWAEKITPHMDIENNVSPSFNAFKTEMDALTT
jgi:hypothetical protein